MASSSTLMLREPEARSEPFLADVLQGLAQSPKVVPARWLYDDNGSALFEAITRLPEYYPTRVESGILTQSAEAIADAVGPGRALVEFGAGSAAKTPLVLDAISPAAYVALDISGDFLRDACARLQERYPDLPITALEADFMRPATLPSSIADFPKLGFFPGSTIGNLAPAAAVDLLRAMRATLGDGAMLLIGMDRVKPAEVLTLAYDDAAGVTSAFNLNLAARINRELDGTIPLDALRHRAVWNSGLSRIEMHLEAIRAFRFSVAGRAFAMAEGETIHTENSHKYQPATATTLLIAGGWTPVARFTDSEERFLVIVAEARIPQLEP
jgi:L-histidine N-alpha-methyltransferase